MFVYLILKQIMTGWRNPCWAQSDEMLQLCFELKPKLKTGLYMYLLEQGHFVQSMLEDVSSLWWVTNDTGGDCGPN